MPSGATSPSSPRSAPGVVAEGHVKHGHEACNPAGEIPAGALSSRPSWRQAALRGLAAQMSRLRTLSAFRSMNSRRGST